MRCPPENDLKRLNWTPNELTARLQQEVWDYILNLMNKSENLHGEDDGEWPGWVTETFVWKLARVLADFSTDNQPKKQY